MSELATLELRDAVLRRAGSALTPALTLTTSAPRLGLVGDWSPLLELATGQAELASGSAQLLGAPLQTAIADGLLGFAACDPPWPAAFTVTEYLEHAARLSHGSKARAVQDARQAIERFELGELAQRKLSNTYLHQQRAIGIAQTSLTSPQVVCLEAPLRGLDAQAADYVARLCAEVARHARLIVSAARPTSPSAERSLLDACDELFVLEADALVCHGSPDAVFEPRGRYWLTLASSGADNTAFSGALSAAGCRVTARARRDDYLIELPPEGSTDLLLDTALAHGVTVIGLEPVFSTP